MSRSLGAPGLACPNPSFPTPLFGTPGTAGCPGVWEPQLQLPYISDCIFLPTERCLDASLKPSTCPAAVWDERSQHFTSPDLPCGRVEHGPTPTSLPTRFPNSSKACLILPKISGSTKSYTLKWVQDGYMASPMQSWTGGQHDFPRS